MTTPSSPIPFDDAANLQHLWCLGIIASLNHLGADRFVVSPGYRCAPLLYALRTLNRSRGNAGMIYSQVDERAAGYFALGMSKAGVKLPVLICTSGTAMANYFPAVLEAYNDRVPLVILTADRPFELHDCGANQTLQQPHLFGSYCSHTLPLPEPTEAVNPTALYYRLEQAIAVARRSRRPIHINLPLREPLEPVPQPISPAYHQTWASTFATPPRSLQSSALESFSPPKDGGGGFGQAWPSWHSQYSQWLVVVGSLPRHEHQQAELVAWLRTCGAPIYCDVTSGLKHVLADHPSLLIDPEDPSTITALKARRAHTAVLHLGDRVTSGPILRLLQQGGEAPYIRLSPSRNTPYNPGGAITHTFAADFSALASAAPLERDASLPAPAKQASCWDRHAIAQQIADTLRDGDVLYLGNSSTVRFFNRVAYKSCHDLRVEANRGVSGIEGIISSAKGYHHGSDRRVVAVLGDISFLYDLNALLDPYLTSAIKLIVLNDQRGSIFEQLPGRHYDGFINDLMTTPHSHRFAKLLAGFPIKIRTATDTDSLALSLDAMMASSTAELLEIMVDCATT